jgi:hypothetical protein
LVRSNATRQVERIDYSERTSESRPPIPLLVYKARKFARANRVNIGVIVLGLLIVVLIVFVDLELMRRENTSAITSTTKPSGSPTLQATSEGNPPSGVDIVQPADIIKPQVIPVRPSIPPCAEGQTPFRPRTGATLGHAHDSLDGLSELKITNGRESDAAVRLVETLTNATVIFVYVQAGDTHTVRGIPPGEYFLRFASGQEWVGACRRFLQTESFKEFERTLIFEESTTDSEEVYSKKSLTLYPVIGGNARTRAIDERRFLEGD